MSEGEEGKVAVERSCQDEMKNSNDELIDLAEDGKEENQDTFDDATCEVWSTHSSLEDINSGTDDEASEVLSQHSSLVDVNSNKVDSSDGADDDELNPKTFSAQLKDDAPKKPPKRACYPNKKGPFKCPKCQHSFKEKSKLTRHLKYINCEIVPIFPCPHCDYRTISKRHFEAHLIKKHNVHRSQLPGSDFYQNSYPFKCNECSRNYKNKGSLKRHVEFECGVSPAFTCPLCDHQTYQNQNLRSHLIKFHKVERSQLSSYEVGPIFKCALCPFRTQLKTDLQKHVRAEHHNN